MASSSIESPPLHSWLRPTDASRNSIASIYLPQHYLVLACGQTAEIAPWVHTQSRERALEARVPIQLDG
nr:hypothetical protein MFLOJ_34720 [Mycobacterium florentinum]